MKWVANRGVILDIAIVNIDHSHKLRTPSPDVDCWHWCPLFLPPVNPTCTQVHKIDWQPGAEEVAADQKGASRCSERRIKGVIQAAGLVLASAAVSVMLCRRMASRSEPRHGAVINSAVNICPDLHLRWHALCIDWEEKLAAPLSLVKRLGGQQWLMPTTSTDVSLWNDWWLLSGDHVRHKSVC